MKVFSMGYVNTGSSAVTHLMREYSKCTTGRFEKNYEHVLFYTPGGLFDLEDTLLRNNSLFRSDAALDAFCEAMRKLDEYDFGWFGGYRNRCGDGFERIVTKFVDSLCEYEMGGNWFYDNKYERRFSQYIRDIVKFILRRKILDFGKRVIPDGDGRVRFSFVTEDEFYEKAKGFVDGYFNLVGDGSKDTLVVDQPLLPFHLCRLDHYFGDDVRCIVIDRDPRDQFILSKYVSRWLRCSGFFPADVNDFVKFQTRFRKMEIKVDDPRILRLHFEDMVYQYEKTIKIMEDFVGLENLGEHVYVRKYFDPEISIKNTQNFRIKPEWEEEVKPIEEGLKEYLYDFPYEFHPKLEETSDP